MFLSGKTKLAEVMRFRVIRLVVFTGIRSDGCSIAMVKSVFRHIERYEETKNHIEASCCTFSGLLRLAMVSGKSGGP